MTEPTDNDGPKLVSDNGPATGVGLLNPEDVVNDYDELGMLTTGFVADDDEKQQLTFIVGGKELPFLSALSVKKLLTLHDDMDWAGLEADIADDLLCGALCILGSYGKGGFNRELPRARIRQLAVRVLNGLDHLDTLDGDGT